MCPLFFGCARSWSDESVVGQMYPGFFVFDMVLFA